MCIRDRRDNGAMDDKILAIPFGDPMFNGYSALSDLPAHISNEISHFFSVYKHLEPDTNAEVDSVHGLSLIHIYGRLRRVP